MNLKNNLINLLGVMAVIFLAIGITLLNTEEPSWAGNEKAYAGITSGVILIALRFVMKKKAREEDSGSDQNSK
ncbi:hypothetical protein [Salibacter sp.]|uniref:hypothetical protein n=1 Tax=Salibacter sp. TaxID=2010995 RepID=UPI00286FBF3E|nr:hypothetical protein [Salibacter sp.]MDR9397895.1 hypothetical protein [Salibacter sp.]MDR9486583.1 hypothetical protein [Salibacter sp.]